MDLIIHPSATCRLGNRTVSCAVGWGGIGDKQREGDGITPRGRWACRALLYRPDRLARPVTGLPISPIIQEDGWCDAPDDPSYNRRIIRPHPACHEALWRDDGVYDLIVPLGFNDDPVIPGRGSAIFLHLATADFTPTAGCVALGRDDLMAFLVAADMTTHVVVV